MWLSTVTCLFLVLYLVEVHSLGGHVCTTRRSRTQSYVAYERKRQSQSYRSKCGLFGWKRCRRNRYYYTKVAVNRQRTAYYTQEKCCSNWRLDTSGRNCRIHGSSPTVTFCQTNIRAQASRKTKNVSWTEPSFSEPYNFSLRYTRHYVEPHGEFPWGDTLVKYLVTSTNNGKQAKCEFTITVVLPYLCHVVLMVIAIAIMIVSW